MRGREEAVGRVHHGHFWERALALGLATALLVLVATSDQLHGALIDLFEAADEVIERHPVAGPVAFVLLATISAMLAFFSSGVLVPAGIVAWGRVGTFALLWLGWTLGGIASYAAARWLGRPAISVLGARPQLSRWEAALSRHASFRVALLFQLAVPSEVPGYVLGFLRFPFRRYLGALLVAELPFAAGTVLLGASFLGRQKTLIVAIGLVGVLGSLLAFRALHRRVDAPARP
jgi:uncharacterized membrane protein YdjX (TVP38/TMEM64 family)